MKNFEVKEQGNNNNTLLSAIKLAYHQYKRDLYFVKNKSNIWEGKPYRWGLTHWAIAKNRFYWFVIKR
jgi:hypothetical protein